jgi:inner membrane protein|tara:strand:+ start:37916 stop:38872 length:957 start_codon:yes stop_codon:yes gene_type:complete
MDNLAHTLAGAALAEAGLKEKTGLGLATLMIAANLPDVDIIVLAFGENLAYRRGVTHGPLGLVVLPLVLTALMVWFDRWQDRRGKRPASRLPVRPGWLLLLAYIGILTHPFLDWLNVYGIRCLAPFSDEWFYGDTLFIIDVWLWSVLAIGTFLSQRRRRAGKDAPRIPARAALGAVVLYIGAMGAGTAVAENRTRAAVIAAGYGTPKTVIASPPPVNPFRRDMIYRASGNIGEGVARFTPGLDLRLGEAPFADNMDDPAVARAMAVSKPLRDFLFWARTPYARIEETPMGTNVTVSDARYDDSPNGGTFTVKVALPPE